MTKFLYGKIVIDNVSDSSLVQYGENFQSGFTNTTKVNDGFGRFSAKHSVMQSNVHVVSDSDQFDAWGSQGWRQRDET